MRSMKPCATKLVKKPKRRASEPPPVLVEVVPEPELAQAMLEW